MTYKKFAAVFAVLLLLATMAFAAGLINRDDQDIMGNWRFWNTVTFQGTNSALVLTDATITGTGKITATHVANVERHITLPLTGFTTNGAPVTASTAPGFELDDSIANIVWADGETTPILISFPVPADYASGGAFRALSTESDSTTPNQIDFDVFVNIDGTAVDSSGTGQTPVALAGTTSTPDVVTLTPATDFASLAAGQWITFRMWRDNVAAGTGDLEIKGADFYYTATQ